MRLHPKVLTPRHVSRVASNINYRSRRPLITLAIETSCDDTSVAVLESKTDIIPGNPRALLHFHKKITANNSAFRGVHPLTALYSHQENLANLVNEAIQHLPEAYDSHTNAISIRDGWNNVNMRRRPDFISVTRGPGMRSNLFTGLDTAKGLATAWQVDLVGVHHMQAHALTPRLVKALQPTEAHGSSAATTEPEFPFLSVLVSGGHTMILHSASLTQHAVLSNTIDTAIGDCLDKIARAVLPSEVMSNAKTTMYGALLEEFAFPDASDDIKRISKSKKGTEEAESRNEYPLEDSTAAEYCAKYGAQGGYGYAVPKNGEDQRTRGMTEWGWSFNPPLSRPSGGGKSRTLDMSFSGLQSAVERVIQFGMDKSTGKVNKTERPPTGITLEERRAIARESMRTVFEHLASRVVLALQLIAEDPDSTSIGTVVMSGGVAANRFLRFILASTLTARGYSELRIVFPPPSLCTDNAAMIAWAGLEMYQAGYRDPYSIRAIRKWPLDELLSPPQDG
ncbi:hypothetical protein GQ43DRAFT_473379 [Delitschia confertaspora ATCC 74209]|uniref:Gcp-like domain-containing protein n=1 Tax=Delitschia confertaspora ATCC 74209 TaxID=1513339 RepID=A0A9P4MU39_9PLEO|nr:hypothetical protein GQ43DRAFT_473379 [Delitschia confertaspora ATCC 74209]